MHLTFGAPANTTGINGTNPITYGRNEGTGFLSLDAYSAYLGLSVGNTYPFDFFFCERYTNASTFTLNSTIELIDCPAIDVCGVCNGPTLVNACDNPTLLCGHGVCTCATGECLCDAGWVHGPEGNCSQRCGNGILEGNEQCDLGVYPPADTGCCTARCMWAPRGTPCTGPSAGLSCVTDNVCPGTAATCGAPLPIGTACTAAGAAPGACQTRQCTAADGSVCEPAANPDLGAVWYAVISKSSGLCLTAERQVPRREGCVRHCRRNYSAVRLSLCCCVVLSCV